MQLKGLCCFYLIRSDTPGVTLVTPDPAGAAGAV